MLRIWNIVYIFLEVADAESQSNARVSCQWVTVLNHVFNRTKLSYSEELQNLMQEKKTKNYNVVNNYLLQHHKT